MPLHLITGRPNSGKTATLYEAASSADGVPTFLLPSAPDVARARRELCVERGLVALRIIQIDRYLAGLWEIHGDGRRLVTPTQRAALLRTAINQSEIHNLTASARTRGFASALERLAGLMTGDLGAPSAGLAGGITDCLARYRRSLESHGLVEPAEATSVIADRVSCIVFDGPLIANRFDDLTQPQELFLVSAAKAGAEVWLAVTAQAGSPATEATRELVDRLAASADTVGECEAKPAAEDEVRSLEAAVFMEHSGLKATGAVVVSEAYGEEAEAERIAAEVVGFVSAGVDCGEIAVIYRDTKRHHAALRRAFEDAGIPADFDIRLGFGETGFGRAMMALLAFATTSKRSQMVAFLGGGFAGLEAGKADELDAGWRRGGVTDDARRMVKELSRVDRALGAIAGQALRLVRERVTPDSAFAWKSLAGEVLSRRYGREARLLSDEELVDAAAHRRFCEAVDDLADLGSLACDPLELREILGASRIALSARERAGHVQVMDVERVRGRRFRCVVIAGLIAGEFPRKPREGVFTGSRLAEELERSGVVLPRDGGLPEERLLFYLALSRAQERLVLSHQVADSEGRPLRASSFLDESLALYGDTSRPPVRTLAFADLGVHPAAPDLTRRALRTVAMSDSGNDIGRIALARARAAGTAARITDEALLADLSERHSFAVTELERYLQCPYLWFYDRFVRPVPLEEELDARVQGTLAHAVLRDFYTMLPERVGESRVTAENLEASLVLAEGIVDEVISSSLGATRLNELLLERRVRRMVRALVSRDARFLSGYTPTHLEWSFGRDEDAPIEFPGFSLRGQVDRIDTAGERFVVIDYKTGGVTPFARFETDGILQAPLYAEAVRMRLGGVCAGSFYRGLRPKTRTDQCRGVYDVSLLSDPELVRTDAVQDCREAIVSAIERAAGAADGIRQGCIERRPLSEKSCRYCQAAAWCEEGKR